MSLAEVWGPDGDDWCCKETLTGHESTARPARFKRFTYLFLALGLLDYFNTRCTTIHLDSFTLARRWLTVQVSAPGVGLVFRLQRLALRHLRPGHVCHVTRIFHEFSDCMASKQSLKRSKTPKHWMRLLLERTCEVVRRDMGHLRLR